MTKLTLGKTLSLETQAKLDQLTGSGSNSQLQHHAQTSQTKADQRVQENSQNSSKNKQQSNKQSDVQQINFNQPQDSKQAVDPQTKIDSKAHEISQKQLSYQAFIAACDYLMDTYPEAFNIDDPKPLKLHIEQDIYAQLPVAMSRTKIRQALSAYTKRTDYLQSFEKYTQRIDLTGAFVDDVTETQKEHAAQALKAAMDKQEPRRQVKRDKRENDCTSMEQAPIFSTDMDETQAEYEVKSIDQK